MITVRDADEHDIPALIKLEYQIFNHHRSARPDRFRACAQPFSQDDAEKLLSSTDSIVLVADEDGAAVAVCIIIIRERTGHRIFSDEKWLEIDDICVDEKHRGQGIGTALINEVKKRAETLSIPHIELCVWEFNRSAKELYSRLGFSSRIERMELDLHGNEKKG